MNRWEIAANVANTASIVLAAKNSVHLWWTGIIGTGIFVYVFAHNQLYADASLQVFFIITGFIGWKTWRRTRGVPQLPVTRAGGKRIGLLVLAAPLHQRVRTVCGFVRCRCERGGSVLVDGSSNGDLAWLAHRQHGFRPVVFLPRPYGNRVALRSLLVQRLPRLVALAPGIRVLFSQLNA
jgi:Nicotinamide mononucleotide transporter